MLAYEATDTGRKAYVWPATPLHLRLPFCCVYRAVEYTAGLSWRGVGKRTRDFQLQLARCRGNCETRKKIPNERIKRYGDIQECGSDASVAALA